MKSDFLLLPVLLFFTGVNASPFAPPHPCLAYATKVSKLSACATGRSFCSKFLGGTASFTRTSTSTVVVPYAPVTSTTTTTSTLTETDTTSTTTVTTSTETLTTTSTTTQVIPACEKGASDQADLEQRRTYDSQCTPIPTVKARAVKPRAPKKIDVDVVSSCNMRADAVPSQVSGACNCILASSTTITSTSTSGIALIATITETDTVTSTTSVTSTITITSTTTTTIGTLATTCAASFYLQLKDSPTSENGDVAQLQDYGGSSSSFAFSNADTMFATLFSLDPEGHLLTGSDIITSYGALRDLFARPTANAHVQNMGNLLCIISPTQELFCEDQTPGKTLSGFQYCAGSDLQVGGSSSGSSSEPTCPTTDIFVIASDGS